MKPLTFFLMIIGVFFGSMHNPANAKESRASEALSGLQTQVQFHPSPAFNQRAIERLLLSVNQRCEGQDSACFGRKLGIDSRYHASSKV